MRNPHHQQQQLLLSLATLICIIIFKARLLNGQLAKGEGAMSCITTSCPIFKNVTLLPFFTSQACGSASSFVIPPCNLSNTETEKPTWPNFVKATPGNNTLGPPSVMGFFNPLQIPNPFIQDNINASKNSTINGKNSTINGKFGFINLTWSDALISENACASRVSLDQISHSLPLSINLTSFAHSVFQLSPSNIILLFNCSPSSSVSHDILQKNTSACRSYGKFCTLPKVEGSNCYQYVPDSKELNLSQAMKSFNCTNAAFFVVPNPKMPALQWSPGLIQLSWSTDKPWIASYIKSCVDCLQIKGACGYGNEDNFQCYCAKNGVSGTNCTVTVEASEPPGSPCSSFKCHIGPKIAIGAVGFAIALSISLALFCICKRKLFMKITAPCSPPHCNKSSKPTR